VVANFLHLPQEKYIIGFPAEGEWQLRFNGDAAAYSGDFDDFQSSGIMTELGNCDGMPWHAAISIAPYSILIFSQPNNI
jgi:1,4-alpha-glucan branching enzyme